MNTIWIFYLGALTGAIVTFTVLALFAVGSRADQPLSSSSLFSETYELPDNIPNANIPPDTASHQAPGSSKPA